jgi:hypothetical protein
MTVLYGITPMLYNADPAAPGISVVLTNELRLAGFPALQDDRILFGTAALKARRSPPSVVAVWSGSGATGQEYGTEFVQPGALPTIPVLNSLGTDLMRVDYYCWAEAYPPDPEHVRDADAARYLAHQLWRVIHRVAVEGAVRILGIDTSEDPPTSLGFQCVLRVEHRTPVPDNLLAYILPGTTGTVTVGGTTSDPADPTIQLPGVVN